MNGEKLSGKFSLARHLLTSSTRRPVSCTNVRTTITWIILKVIICGYVNRQREHTPLFSVFFLDCACEIEFSLQAVKANAFDIMCDLRKPIVNFDFKALRCSEVDGKKQSLYIISVKIPSMARQF